MGRPVLHPDKRTRWQKVKKAHLQRIVAWAGRDLDEAEMIMATNTAVAYTQLDQLAETIVRGEATNWTHTQVVALNHRVDKNLLALGIGVHARVKQPVSTKSNRSKLTGSNGGQPMRERLAGGNGAANG